jgi:hypothetical protein
MTCKSTARSGASASFRSSEWQSGVTVFDCETVVYVEDVQELANELWP